MIVYFQPTHVCQCFEPIIEQDFEQVLFMYKHYNIWAFLCDRTILMVPGEASGFLLSMKSQETLHSASLPMALLRSV